MNEEESGGTIECCIDGVAVTAELLAIYRRSWARQGVYFETQPGQSGELRDNVQVEPARVICRDVLTYRFSHRHPDATRRGRLNEEFLCPAGLEGMVVSEHISTGRVIVFPLSHVYPTEGLTLQKLLCRLAPFLSALPPGHRYAFGVQNREYLLPAYFDCLRKYSVAHAFCTGQTMPGLLDQAQLPYALTGNVAVVLTEPRLDVEWQLGMMEIVRRCVDARKELYVCLESSREGQTIPSLAVLMERMSGDLARLSPIRATKAA